MASAAACLVHSALPHDPVSSPWSFCRAFSSASRFRAVALFPSVFGAKSAADRNSIGFSANSFCESLFAALFDASLR